MRLAIGRNGSLLALLSGVLKVRRLIVRLHYYHFAALLLQFAHISIAQFGAPLKARWIVTFDVIEGPMSMEAGCVFAKLVNMPFYDHARLPLYGCRA